MYGPTLTQQCWFHWGYKQHWAQTLCAGWGNTTSEAYIPCLDAVILSCKKNLILWMCVGCVHLLFNLMLIMCSVLFQYWMARPHCFCLPSPSWHSAALACWPLLCLPLTRVTPSHGPSARTAALTTFKSLREMVTKSSLKQGQLNLLSFLCSPKAETGSFRGAASSPKQLLWICLQRSLPLSFSHTAVFHEVGVIPLAGKGRWFAEY